MESLHARFGQTTQVLQGKHTLLLPTTEEWEQTQYGPQTDRRIQETRALLYLFMLQQKPGDIHAGWPVLLKWRVAMEMSELAGRGEHCIPGRTAGGVAAGKARCSPSS